MRFQKFNLNDVVSLNHNFDDSYEYNGVNVPRVTKIIQDCMYEDYIPQWANSLGFKHKSYRETLNFYADYGTAVHKALEDHIKGNPLPPETPMYPIHAFENWWKQLSSNNEVKVLGQEFKLSTPYYGGTYDMLLSINGNPWLVDFKTSNHVNFRYCLQLAAYREMLRYNNIADVSGVMILRFFKDRPLFEEFILDMNIPNHKEFLDNCLRMFHCMVYQYWWRHQLEQDFNTIYKEGRR